MSANAKENVGSSWMKYDTVKDDQRGQGPISSVVEQCPSKAKVLGLIPKCDRILL